MSPALLSTSILGAGVLRNDLGVVQTKLCNVLSCSTCRAGFGDHPEILTDVMQSPVPPLLLG